MWIAIHFPNVSWKVCNICILPKKTRLLNSNDKILLRLWLNYGEANKSTDFYFDLLEGKFPLLRMENSRNLLLLSISVHQFSDILSVQINTGRLL